MAGRLVSKGRWTAGLLVLLFMLAALFLFTHPLWSGKQLLFLGDITTSDVSDLNFPSRHLLSASLKDGRLPFWNPYIGCGFPALAEGQSGLLYPLNIALFATLDPALSFNLSVVLSLFLTLLFSYLLARLYGLSRPASLYSSVAFTFSGFVMAKVKFTYMVNSIAWIPLALYGLEKSFRRKSLKYFLLSGFALAMQLLAGGPQIFFITCLLLLLVFAWRLAALAREKGAGPSERRKACGAFLVGFLLCILLAVSLAAPQLIPQVMSFPQFNRSDFGSFQAILGISMKPKALSLFFSPYQHGNPAYGTGSLKRYLFWEDVAYPGLLTLVLCLIALVFLAKKDRDVIMWFLLIVAALIVALGDSTPLAGFLYKYVPGFNMFRFFQRFMLITVLGMAVLAGKGLDRLLAAFGSRRPQAAAVIVLVLAVLLADLALFSHRQISTIDADRMLSAGESVAFLKEKMDAENYRYSTLGEDEAWKTAYRQSQGWMGGKDLYYEYLKFLPPNFNSAFAIPGAQQYGAYGLGPVKMLWVYTYYGKVRGEGWKRTLPAGVVGCLAAQSVKYVVTPYVLEQEGLEEVAAFATGLRGTNLHIYEVRDALPRVSVFTRYEIVEDPASLTLPELDDLFRPLSKIRDRVILERDPEPIFGPSSGNAGEARIVSSDDRRVVVEADVPEGGLLVLNDAYFPEWRAFVDGEEREVLKANVAFRAVALEPGRHRVEFVYKPVSSYYGFLVCAAGLILIVLVLLQHRRTSWLDVPALGAAPDGERSAKPA